MAEDLLQTDSDTCPLARNLRVWPTGPLHRAAYDVADNFPQKKTLIE